MGTVGVSESGYERWGDMAKIEDPSFLLKDRIGIFLQPARSSIQDFRLIAKALRDTYDGCFIVAGSVEDDANGHRALIRMIWLSELYETTVVVREAFFETEDIAQQAKALAKHLAMDARLFVTQYLTK